MNDIILTAMCIWEQFIGEERTPQMQAALENCGTAEIRDALAGFAQQCHAEWGTAAAAGFDDCFDWVWVPQWMENKIEWSSGYPVLR